MEHGGSPDSTGRLRGLGAIAHPVALLALVALVVHDVLLRPMLPAVVAGKVSDVAGLVVFPLVIAALVAMASDDDGVPIRVGAWVTVVWFSAMKLVGVVATATARLAEVVTPAASVTVDPTDLLALPAVLVAVWVWRHRVPPRAWGAPILVFAVMWSAATSCDSTHPHGGDLSLRSDGSFLVDGLPVRVTSDGRVEELDGQEDDEVRGPGPATVTSACLDDGTCFRADGHDVVAVSPDGTVRTVVDIPEDRFIYARRAGDACDQPDRYRPVQDIAANDDGVVVVAHGSHGVSIRAATGEWTRPDVGATRFAGPVPVGLGTVAISVAILGLLLATVPASYLAVASVLAMMAAAGAAFLSAVGGFGLLLAWPALLVVGCVAVVQLFVLADRGLGRRAAVTTLGHLVAGTVAWLVIWAWSAAWIANLWLALALVAASVVPVTALSIVQGRRDGSWPTPPATSQEPSFPEGPVRGGPLE